jgi:hypothetical protein
MGRKSLYDTHVKPYLNQIQEWYSDLDERQIAVDKLGIAVSTWEKYKKEHEELRNVLKNGRQNLVIELKASLKKKAKGFYYEETKECIREADDGRKIKTVEKYKKYAQPDTGALHLLLKNLDDNWHNDDKATLDLKQKQLELTERKIEQNEW